MLTWLLLDAKRVIPIGRIGSMAIPGTQIGGTYHILGLCKAYVREYTPKIWPEIWYVYVPPCIGSWRSPVDRMVTINVPPFIGNKQTKLCSLFWCPIRPLNIDPDHRQYLEYEFSSNPPCENFTGSTAVDFSCLVVEPYPSEKYEWKSVGIMNFPTEWKVIKFHGSSQHQPLWDLDIP